MKNFTIKANKYVDRDVTGYYNCDNVGYQKQGNPDFINRLKNMSKQYSETDLVEDFVTVCEKLTNDLKAIVNKEIRTNRFFDVKFDKNLSQEF